MLLRVSPRRRSPPTRSSSCSLSLSYNSTAAEIIFYFMRHFAPPARLTAVLIVAVFLALQLTACTTPKADLQRARELETSGRFSDAALRYRQLLDRVPQNEPRLRAMLQVRIGQCLFSAGQLPEAAHAFQSAVDLDNDLLVAHLRLAEIYLVGNAPQAALKHAETVLAREPDNAEAIVAAGAAYGSLGDSRLAKIYLQKGFERDPSRENIAVTLAEIYFDDQDPAAARAILLKAAALNPRSPRSWLALGRMAERQGDDAAAEEAYRRAVVIDNSPDTNLRLAQFLQRSARIPEARQVLERVDRQRPSLPTAVADFDLFSGHAAEAEENYLAALARSLAPQPDAKPADRGPIVARLVEADLQRASRDFGAIAAARAHLQQFRSTIDNATAAVLQAEIALAANDVTQAANSAQQAVDLAADSPAAHYVLGMAFRRAGDGANALIEWNRALERDPDFLPAHMVLAQEAYTAGSFELAEEHIADVVREEPGNFAALVLYARALEGQRRYDAAESLANRAAALRRDAVEPRVLLGDLALDRGRPGQALIDFEHAVLLDPHSSEAMNGLIRTYRKGTVTRDVLRKMERTAAAAPVSPTLMEIAGRLYADHRWYADAIRCLRGSLAMDSGRTSARDELVRVYLATGNTHAALSWVERGHGPAANLAAGIRAQQSDDTAAAIRQYEAAVPRDPSGVAANNLAWLYATEGRNLERALDLANSAHDRAPNNPSILDTIGFVYLQRREYTAAINFLRQAIALAHGPAADARPAPAEVTEFHRHLAEAYLRSGQPQLAAAELDRLNR